MLEYNCGECQERITGPPLNHDMVRRGLCYNCNFWEIWVERKDHPDYESHIARINGEQYLLGPEDTFARPRGMGGVHKVILFKDGRTVESTNVWHNGMIPLHFRNRLPDNATFVEPLEKEEAAI